jgi:23S rRNA U2552 (ribose-2'-O)-methylase RlmE/FtsJ
MIEICSELKLLEKYNNCNMKTFHLAEGPGGFIEALTYLRSNNEDQYYGMTLIDGNDYVPGWKKSKTFLENHNNVNIETGITGNGDLLQKENLLYCYEKYKNTMDLITADGGFDFSIDFNKQELVASKLLFAQVVFALAMQKNGGEFVLKVFDIFTKSTVDILYLLSTLYDSVYIMKPNTSRIANSERYIICKKFVKPKQYDSLMNRIIDNYHQVNTMDYITSIFDFSLNYYFINKLEEYNAILGQQQIENIMYTINLLQSRQKNEKIESHKRNNINKCVMWCAKYRLPHYNDSNINTVSNRFIPDMIKVDENRQCDNSVNMVA